MRPLTPEQKRQILESAESVRQCAARIGVSKSAVHKVRNPPVQVDAPGPSTWTDIVQAAWDMPERELIAQALGGVHADGIRRALTELGLTGAEGQQIFIDGAGPADIRAFAALHPDKGVHADAFTQVSARVQRCKDANVHRFRPTDALTDLVNMSKADFEATVKEARKRRPRGR